MACRRVSPHPEQQRMATPASYAVYPDRLILLLLIPAAAMLAIAANTIPKHGSCSWLSWSQRCSRYGVTGLPTTNTSR